MPNQLPEILSGSNEYTNHVGLYDVAEMELQITGDIVSQNVLCFTTGSRHSLVNNEILHP